LIGNRDFAGREILKTGDARHWPQQLADYLGGNFASSLAPVSQALQGKESAADAAKKFAEENIGVSTPSPAALKYQQKQPKLEAQQARKSSGLIEYLSKQAGM
jgi:hypothetical protein